MPFTFECLDNEMDNNDIRYHLQLFFLFIPFFLLNSPSQPLLYLYI